MTKVSPRHHSDEFKQEAVNLVLKEGYSVAADAAKAVGVTTSLSQVEKQTDPRANFK